MAVITYEKEHWNTNFIGKNWNAYRWENKKDTLIIYELWKFIDNNRNVEFNMLCNLIKSYHKNKTVRSSVTIIESEKRLEIIRKGIFPSILLTKN